MVIPFTPSPNDIYYKGMDSHNSVILNDQYIITGYNVNQGNKYPTLYPGQMNANNVPGIENTGTNNFIPNSRYLQDLSYLRVKNITLGYTLPAEWTTKAYIQKARIYFSGENLFFIHRGNKVQASTPKSQLRNGLRTPPPATSMPMPGDAQTPSSAYTPSAFRLLSNLLTVASNEKNRNNISIGCGGRGNDVLRQLS